jgi:hypothetical protein
MHGTGDGTGPVQRLYEAVVRAAPGDLRGQPRAFKRLGEDESRDTKATVRGRIFEAHGWQN